MQTLPAFESYGHYSNSNYGAHALMFTDAAGNDFYFSYKTLVAFRRQGRLVIRENVWGPTTGKHLNWISIDKARRVSERVFQSALSHAFGNKVVKAA